MFEGLLNNLNDDINTIRSIINISEKLREIIADNSSQLNTEDLKYIQANAPLGDKWLVNDHCSSITRLYALYENFVENLVGDWIILMPQLYSCYQDLPESVRNQHKTGCATLLGNEYKRNRFDSLSERDIIKNLFDTEYENTSRYNLTSAAFLLHEANLRKEQLTKLLANAGISATDSWQWIENHKKVKIFIDNNDKRSVEKELKNFIELRNNSAHGKVDTVLNANDLLKLCDFVEAICQAISELVLYYFVYRKIEIGKLQKIGKVVKWYQQPQVCAVKILDEPQESNKRLEVGKKVFLVSEKKKICQNAIIESIQINRNGKNTPRRRITIREIKDSIIGLKFDKEGQEGLEVYWLFWFLCGNEVYTDSFFHKIVLKVLPSKHFTIP
ncbi:MAG: hypothetical protein GPJ17_07935 [Microcystis aeruginosa K13-07]|jgi:hypothetical protein|nr:hypothetical protein [Microcystis aeruginosa K13-07]